MSNSSGASGIGETMVNKGKEGKAHVVTEKSWKWGVWKEKFYLVDKGHSRKKGDKS